MYTYFSRDFDNFIPVPDSNETESDSESCSIKSVNLVNYVDGDFSTNSENRIILKAKRKLNQSQGTVDVDELVEQLNILDALSKVEPETLINCNCGYSASKCNSLFTHLHKPIINCCHYNSNKWNGYCNENVVSHSQKIDKNNL